MKLNWNKFDRQREGIINNALYIRLFEDVPVRAVKGEGECMAHLQQYFVC